MKFFLTFIATLAVAAQGHVSELWTTGATGQTLEAVNPASGVATWRINLKDVAGKQWNAGFVTNDVIQADKEAVFLSSDDGHLYAVDSGKGSLQWVFNTEYSLCTRPRVSTRLGLVYVAGVGISASTFYALDAQNGSVKWTASNLIGPPPLLSPDEATLYVEGGKNQKGDTIVALDSKSGSLKWEFNINIAAKAEPRFGDDASQLSSDGRVLYAGVSLAGTNARNGILYAIDVKHGKKIWTYEVGHEIQSLILSADGRTAYAESAVGLSAISDGSMQWHFALDGARLAHGAQVTLSPDGETIYIGADDGFLYAVDAADGTARWRADCTALWGFFPPAVSSDGSAVYALGPASPLLRFDAQTGARQWMFNATKHVSTGAAPALSADGRVVYSGRMHGGSMYAVDAAAGTQIWEYVDSSL